MADPTSKDVLKAIAKVQTDAVDRRFDRVDERLDDLDTDIDRHMSTHREIEKDLQNLKRRPPRTAARAPRRR